MIIRTLFLFLLCLRTVSLLAQPVTIIGALKRVKHEGKLSGIVQLDTLKGQAKYGLGPVADLRGEILLWNDTVYVARVAEGHDTVAVEPTVPAPFLVYASVPAWTPGHTLTDSVATLAQLQTEVEKRAVALGQSLDEPFPFMLRGVAREVTYHVMDKPEGETQHDPARHQQAKRFFTDHGATVQLLGFYSRHHEGVFTHRGSYIHVHVMNQARTSMGHLDELHALPETFRLSLPVQ